MSVGVILECVSGPLVGCWLITKGNVLRDKRCVLERKLLHNTNRRRILNFATDKQETYHNTHDYDTQAGHLKSTADTHTSIHNE